MRARYLAATVLCAALAGNASCAPHVQISDAQKAEDEAMEGAMSQARTTLPVFWSKFNSHPADTKAFRIFAGLPTSEGGGHEHLWIDVIGHSGSQVHGRIANDPIDVPGVHLGSDVDVPADRIEDWSYDKGGKRYGAYTQRVVSASESAKLRAELAAELSPTPLESDVH